MYGIFHEIAKHCNDAALPRYPRLTGKNTGDELDPEVSLHAFAISPMPLVLVAFVDHLQMHWRERRVQPFLDFLCYLAQNIPLPKDPDCGLHMGVVAERRKRRQG